MGAAHCRRGCSARRTSSSPKTWSQNSTNIVAQKYFRGQLTSPTRERSVKEMILRVSGTIARWGVSAATSPPRRPGSFETELRHVLVHQVAAFNSPVWFNVRGVRASRRSARRVHPLRRGLDGLVLDWNTTDAVVFRGGFGSGINLSQHAAGDEPVAKGGVASGPVSFMRAADRGWYDQVRRQTRRAAKMCRSTFIIPTSASSSGVRPSRGQGRSAADGRV